MTTDPKPGERGTGGTEEEHVADIARANLARIIELREDFACLARGLQILADWAAEHHPDDVDHRYLDLLAGAMVDFGHDLPEAIRDLASRLPIRDLEY